MFHKVGLEACLVCRVREVRDGDPVDCSCPFTFDIAMSHRDYTCRCQHKSVSAEYPLFERAFMGGVLQSPVRREGVGIEDSLQASPFISSHFIKRILCPRLCPPLKKKRQDHAVKGTSMTSTA